MLQDDLEGCIEEGQYPNDQDLSSSRFDPRIKLSKFIHLCIRQTFKSILPVYTLPQMPLFILRTKGKSVRGQLSLLVILEEVAIHLSCFASSAHQIPDIVQ